MGILITFGSYMKKDVSIEGSTRNVEIFDTAIAIMAGLMIIPAVFAFSGGSAENLKAGPSLMFITIPKVFASMGMGTVVGILFFLLVLFAAVTSSIALTESAVSTFEDEFGWGRQTYLFRRKTEGRRVQSSLYDAQYQLQGPWVYVGSCPWQGGSGLV